MEVDQTGSKVQAALSKPRYLDVSSCCASRCRALRHVRHSLDTASERVVAIGGGWPRGVEGGRAGSSVVASASSGGNSVGARRGSDPTSCGQWCAAPPGPRRWGACRSPAVTDW